MVAAIGTWAAVFAAALYARVTYRLLRTEQSPSVLVADDPAHGVVARNVGRGAALNAVLYYPTDDPRHPDVVSTGVVPPGEGVPFSRTPRVEGTEGHPRWLYFRDLSGRWYVSRVGNRNGHWTSMSPSRVRLLIPAAVRDRIAMRSVAEIFHEHGPLWKRIRYWWRLWMAARKDHDDEPLE